MMKLTFLFLGLGSLIVSDVTLAQVGKRRPEETAPIDPSQCLKLAEEHLITPAACTIQGPSSRSESTSSHSGSFSGHEDKTEVNTRENSWSVDVGTRDRAKDSWSYHLETRDRSASAHEYPVSEERVESFDPFDENSHGKDDGSIAELVERYKDIRSKIEHLKGIRTRILAVLAENKDKYSAQERESVKQILNNLDRIYSLSANLVSDAGRLRGSTEDVKKMENPDALSSRTMAAVLKETFRQYVGLVPQLHDFLQITDQVELHKANLRTIPTFGSISDILDGLSHVGNGLKKIDHVVFKKDLKELVGREILRAQKRVEGNGLKMVQAKNQNDSGTQERYAAKQENDKADLMSLKEGFHTLQKAMNLQPELTESKEIKKEYLSYLELNAEMEFVHLTESEGRIPATLEGAWKGASESLVLYRICHRLNEVLQIESLKLSDEKSSASASSSSQSSNPTIVELSKKLSKTCEQNAILFKKSVEALKKNKESYSQVSEMAFVNSAAEATRLSRSRANSEESLHLANQSLREFVGAYITMANRWNEKLVPKFKSMESSSPKRFNPSELFRAFDDHSSRRLFGDAQVIAHAKKKYFEAEVERIQQEIEKQDKLRKSITDNADGLKQSNLKENAKLLKEALKSLDNVDKTLAKHKSDLEKSKRELQSYHSLQTQLDAVDHARPDPAIGIRSKRSELLELLWQPFRVRQIETHPQLADEWIQRVNTARKNVELDKIIRSESAKLRKPIKDFTAQETSAVKAEATRILAERPDPFKLTGKDREKVIQYIQENGHFPSAASSAGAKLLLEAGVKPITQEELNTLLVDVRKREKAEFEAFEKDHIRLNRSQLQKHLIQQSSQTPLKPEIKRSSGTK